MYYRQANNAVNPVAPTQQQRYFVYKQPAQYVYQQQQAQMRYQPQVQYIQQPVRYLQYQWPVYQRVQYQPVQQPVRYLQYQHPAYQQVPYQYAQAYNLSPRQVYRQIPQKRMVNYNIESYEPENQQKTYAINSFGKPEDPAKRTIRKLFEKENTLAYNIAHYGMKNLNNNQYLYY